jgi:urease accessory protein
MAIELIRNLGAADGRSVPVTVELTWQERQRSRLAVMLDTGEPAAIVLPRGEPMQSGDVLSTEDGQQVKVASALEEILEIRAQSAFELMRLTYHLANRHAPAMLTTDAIYIEPDPVLADLARHLGGIVSTVHRAFEPERGAYHGAHHHDGHHHPGELDEEDRTFGNIGEALSRAAHAR